MEGRKEKSPDAGKRYSLQSRTRKENGTKTGLPLELQSDLLHPHVAQI